MTQLTELDSIRLKLEIFFCFPIFSFLLLPLESPLIRQIPFKAAVCEALRLSESQKSKELGAF